MIRLALQSVLAVAAGRSSRWPAVRRALPELVDAAGRGKGWTEVSDLTAVEDRLRRIHDWSNPADVYGGADYQHDYSDDCAAAIQDWLKRRERDRAEARG